MGDISRQLGTEARPQSPAHSGFEHWADSPGLVAQQRSALKTARAHAPPAAAPSETPPPATEKDPLAQLARLTDRMEPSPRDAALARLFDAPPPAAVVTPEPVKTATVAPPPVKEATSAPTQAEPTPAPEKNKLETQVTPARDRPPESGLTRMYRGIGKNVWDSKEGDALFFSTDPARAAAFGELHYVDVTQAELAKFERSHSKRILEQEPMAANDYRTADPEIIARLTAFEVERGSNAEVKTPAPEPAKPPAPIKAETQAKQVEPPRFAFPPTIGATIAAPLPTVAKTPEAEKTAPVPRVMPPLFTPSGKQLEPTATPTVTKSPEAEKTPQPVAPTPATPAAARGAIPAAQPAELKNAQGKTAKDYLFIREIGGGRGPDRRPAPAPSNADRPLTANEILGRHGNPALEARYAKQQQEQQRRQQQNTASPTAATPAAARGGNVPVEKQAEHNAAQEKKEKTAKDYVFTREIGEGRRGRDDGNDRGGGRERGGGGRTR